jgi:Rrf2 family protein
MVLDIAMHGSKGPVQMSDISRRQGISQKYLEKIIRKLKTAGIVASVRGPKGGHLLARPAEAISVGDIVRALEGDGVLVDCLMDDDSCSNAPGCLTRMIWREGSRAMFRRFDQITLAALIGRMEQGVQFGETCPTVESLRERHVAETPAGPLDCRTAL